MADDSETLTHPVFGVLKWDQQCSYWLGAHEPPDGEALDVIVQPGDGERRDFLKRAADLFLWALSNERRVRSEAIEAELLDLYNDTWRQGDDPVLSAAELEEQLRWVVLEIIDDEGIPPVTFSYRAGDLFGGHFLAVELDAGLKFRDADLQG